VWVSVLTESLGGSSTFQGDHHTLFLYDNGQVWAVGSNLDNQLGLADDNPAKADKVYDPVQVRITGRIAVLKRRADSHRALPQVIFPPPPEDDEDTPDLGPYQDTEEYRNGGAHIVAISAGTHNNLAVSKDGHLYSWGQGSEWAGVEW
jgi:regulator of chromosome condensation